MDNTGKNMKEILKKVGFTDEKIHSLIKTGIIHIAEE